MSTKSCRRAVFGACALLALSSVSALPFSAMAQDTEYVVQTPASSSATADDLKAQLMDLIQAQAPELKSLRAEDQTLRERQKPALDRLNGEVQALIRSQRDTRDALTSERRALRAQQTAYLNLHPNPTEKELAELRTAMQTLKTRQQPIRDKMKSDLLALIDSQKPERDALREERMALREKQRPMRDQLLAAREKLEKQIQLASAEENDDGTLAAAGTIGRNGVVGLDQFAPPADRNARANAPAPVNVDWANPATPPVRTQLAFPAMPPAPDQ